MVGRARREHVAGKVVGVGTRRHVLQRHAVQRIVAVGDRLAAALAQARAVAVGRRCKLGGRRYSSTGYIATEIHLILIEALSSA